MDGEPLESGPSVDGTRSVRMISWTLLLAPLLVLVMGVLRYDYRPAPAAADEESTYLMQAESLLHDGDLQYSRIDFDRHLLSRYGAPTDLRLATGSGGREITYDHPFPYALWLAPFLALRPGTGFAVANALLLAGVLIWAGRRLREPVGPWAPALLGALLFGSAIFAHTYFATGDLFLFCLVLVACVLLRAPEPTPKRALVAGGLLSIPLLTSTWHLPAVLAWFLALPKKSRADLAAAGGLGLFLGSLGLVMVQWWSGGGLGIFGTSRFTFTPETGFPTVDFAAPQWRETVARLSALHWEGALKLAWGFDLALWGWNALLLLVGRSMGLLPYFLPVFLLPFLLRGEARGPKSRRWGWWTALGLFCLGLLVFRPFDLAGGEAVIANRLFLPLAAASVLAWGRPAASSMFRSVAWAGLLATWGMMFLANLWLNPGAHPVADDERHAYVAPAGRILLPYELSRRTLPGGPVLDHVGLRVRLLSPGLGEDYLDRLSMAGDLPADLWLASPEPLGAVVLEMDENGPSSLELDGATVRERILLSDGGIGFRLDPELYRRHNMWWSPREQWIYRLSFRLPEPTDRRIRFRLVGELPVPQEEEPR